MLPQMRSASAVVPQQTHWITSDCSKCWHKNTNTLFWPDLMVDELCLQFKEQQELFTVRSYILLEICQKVTEATKIAICRVVAYFIYPLFFFDLSGSSCIFLHLALLYKYWLSATFSYNELQYSLIPRSLERECRPLVSSPRALSLSLWSACMCWLHRFLF